MGRLEEIVLQQDTRNIAKLNLHFQSLKKRSDFDLDLVFETDLDLVVGILLHNLTSGQFKRGGGTGSPTSNLDFP